MQTERSEDIIAPVTPEEYLKFHTGGVVKFYGAMESSKTRVMISLLFYLIKYQGFENNRVFSNCWIDLPGMHWLRNDELRKVLRRAFNTETGGGKWNRCIFLIMDADDVYSHITQADQECYRDIKKASQAYKTNKYLFYEVHDGLSVPKYLRDKTEISMTAKPRHGEDGVNVYVADRHYEKNYMIPIINISWVNDKYRRFSENY